MRAIRDSRRLRAWAMAALLTTIGAGLAPLACSDTPGPRPATLVAEPVDLDDYTWLADWGEVPPSVGLEQRFPTPEGSARVDVDADSYAAWLRALPIRLDRRTVEDYRGRTLPFSGRWSAGVVPLDVGERDLQQCADTVLRLHAEWLWSMGDDAALRYHFTSGDESRFEDWLAGRRQVVEGNAVRTAEPGEFPTLGRDRAALRGWLDQVFMYAGTRSLALDSEAVPLTEPLEPGDFLVRPGSPGHAVIILDVATAEDGEQLVLVGQGSMPAQELHVLRGDRDATVDGVWFRLPANADAAIPVPGWGALERSSARRLRPGNAPA